MGVAIFRLLRKEHDALSVQDIQVKTGISYSRVLNELRWMREADAIQRKRRPVGAGYLYFIGKSAIPTLSTWTDDAKQYAQSLLEDGYEPREAAEMISQRIGQRVTSKMVSELKAEPVEEKISRKCSRCRTDFQAKSRFYFLCDNCRRLATESGLV
jgi:predicted transcriptional regulator